MHTLHVLIERVPLFPHAYNFVQDGEDNTVAESRWSCEPGLVGDYDYCMLFFDLGGSFTVSHLMLCEFLRYQSREIRLKILYVGL